MGTIIRRNERSWAIEIITQINLMLQGINIRLKRAGGENSLSVNKKSMFPDVLLFEDEAQSKPLQGWELKMPDVLITDEAFIKDATRKAIALGLNSFVIWNFTYGKLYIKGTDHKFQEEKVWTGTDIIRTREDVNTHKDLWIPIVREIIMSVNEYLVNGKITIAPITEVLTEHLMTEIVQRNKSLVAENLQAKANSSMVMERKLKVWWNTFHEEYDKDETNLYFAYAKTILLNWTNRILFANLIRRYHNCADLIKNINNSTSPEEGNEIINQIIKQGDFYNVFKKIDFNDLLPVDTWTDIVDYNQFLFYNQVQNIDQSVLQDLLERTVNVSKREMRGQYSTPFWLADFLCQITVENWTGHCADFCSGTGTIAKAIINNKRKRLRSAEATFDTTWVSDKSAYPLQISNIALTNIDSLNIPIKLFQSDIFELEVGKQVTIKSPVDGTDINVVIPPLSAVISNLPFVKYNNIADDEYDYIKKYNDLIEEKTNISFKLGKTDLYTYIPFKVHELLEDNGRLGIVISNSWLGTEIGKKFFQALLCFYNLRTIVLSNSGRWFENAEVVTTLLVMEKKEIAQPEKNILVDFCLTQKDLKQLSEADLDNLINTVVLREEIDDTLVKLKSYSLSKITAIQEMGISLNALFHNVSWIEELEEKLIPISNALTVKRGERRGWNDLFYPSDGHGIESEYIKPVLKNPANLKSYIAATDMEAFCCHRTKEELQELGHLGALHWINKFENITNGTGIPLPIALNRSGSLWYGMEDDTKADFVTALNPNKRLFVAKFEESTFVDQRFTRLLKKDSNADLELIHALLNSIYGMFAIEAIGFGRGLGVLDASSSNFKQIYMINPDVINECQRDEIKELFKKIKCRNVYDTEIELNDPDRELFDRKVFQAIGKEYVYEDIKKSLLSMQRTRLMVR
ncbi:MAG: hypothetical protein K0R00_1887 [Herbinix sp.]|jgi:hypothetical protein|nr:hypothetical protein [Herbinix sp.]